MNTSRIVVVITPEPAIGREGDITSYLQPHYDNVWGGRRVDVCAFFLVVGLTVSKLCSSGYRSSKEEKEEKVEVVVGEKKGRIFSGKHPQQTGLILQLTLKYRTLRREVITRV